MKTLVYNECRKKLAPLTLSLDSLNRSDRASLACKINDLEGNVVTDTGLISNIFSLVYKA